FVLLRRSLGLRIGRTGLAPSRLFALWAAAAAAAGLALAIRHGSGAALHPVPLALLVLGPYGAAYFALTWAAGVPESRMVLDRVHRRLRRR
ncbi:MAG: murein biosynthesis integral membrane protein MurJ, partial [Candidatus Binatia bacterium]